MYRLFAALLAFASFAFVSHADDATYRDPDGRFSVGVPKNWIAEKPKEEKIALLMAGVGADEKTPLGLCVFIVENMDELKGVSQATIDETLEPMFTAEFWKDSLKGSDDEQVTIVSTGSRDANGHKVHYAVSTSTQTTKDGVDRSKGKEEVHAVPGALHIIACVTDPEKYDAALPDFDAILQSYMPSTGLISQAPAAGSSVLTFYEGPQYGGAARVLAQNTANVVALGFSGAIGSVAVSGAGSWEACEGVNYSGACRTLAANETSMPGQALHIGSIRRIDSIAPANSNVSVGSGVRAALELAKARLVKSH